MQAPTQWIEKYGHTVTSMTELDIFLQIARSIANHSNMLNINTKIILCKRNKKGIKKGKGISLAFRKLYLVKKLAFWLTMPSL